MVEAMIAGERDPRVLAELSKSRMRAKKDQLVEALDGHFAEHHGVVARRILDHIAFLDTSIDSLSAQIAARVSSFEPAIQLLCGIGGWGRPIAETFIAETGGDMTVFPTAGQVAAWSGMVPGRHESAGKRRQAGAPHGNRWLGRVLIEAARAAARTKDTYLSAQYRRLAARRGPNKASVAVAHSMVVSAWHMLSTGEVYRELGADYYRQREDPERATPPPHPTTRGTRLHRHPHRRLTPRSGGISPQGGMSAGLRGTGRNAMGSASQCCLTS
jgi:transposase